MREIIPISIFQYLEVKWESATLIYDKIICSTVPCHILELGLTANVPPQGVYMFHHISI